jgi:hypothetical protein
MNDETQDQLNQALRIKAPSAEAQQRLLEMSAKAEQLAGSSPSIRRHVKKRTLTIAAIVAALGVGAGTAAVAAPTVVEWLEFTPDTSTTLVLDSGVVCQVGFAASPAGGGDGQHAAAAAQTYLENLDLEALPVAKRMAEFAQDGQTMGSPSLDVSRALTDLIGTGMWRYVEEHGYDSSSVSLDGGVQCSDGAGE